MSRLTVLVLLVALLAGCTSGEEEGSTPDDPTSIAAGESLYMANCAECHGEDLRGTDQGPSFLSVVYEPGHHPDESFQLAVMRGVQPHHWNFGPMLPVEGLTTQEVAAIVEFVRDRQDAEGFEPYPP